MADDTEARLRALERSDVEDRTKLLMLLERAERELYPLVALYASLSGRCDQLGRDVEAAHNAAREIEALVEEAREERRAQIEAVEAGAHERILELQMQHRMENRKLAYTLIGLLITSATGVLTVILTGGPQ